MATRYDEVVFMQGDDADEVLKIIYPEQSVASTGWPDGEASGLEHLKGWDCGEAPTGSQDAFPTCMGYGDNTCEDDSYVMVYNYSFTTVGLWRKVKLSKYVYSYRVVRRRELREG